MLDLDESAVVPFPAAENHGSRGHRADRRTHLRLNIDSGVPSSLSPPEARSNRPLHGPLEPDDLSTEGGYGKEQPGGYSSRPYPRHQLDGGRVTRRRIGRNRPHHFRLARRDLQALSGPERIGSGQVIGFHDGCARDSVPSRDAAQRLSAAYDVNALARRRECGRTPVPAPRRFRRSRPVRRSDRCAGVRRARSWAQHEPGKEQCQADRPARDAKTSTHGSNSAYRTPNEVNRPVGGRHVTSTPSTRASGGPLVRSRTSLSMEARTPTTRTRTRPTFRFIT